MLKTFSYRNTISIAGSPPMRANSPQGQVLQFYGTASNDILIIAASALDDSNVAWTREGLYIGNR